MNKVEFNLINNIAQINFNKLSTKNSLDRNDLKKITKFLKEIQNKSLDCLIISSVGNIFSSGMDFKEFSIGDWSKNPISEVCDLIENLPFISISLINGAVYGGSVELVISTDFRFGSKNCKIQIPASKYGIHYGHKGIKRCLNFFGLPISKKLLFFSEPIYLNDLKHINFFDYYDDDIEVLKKTMNEKIELLSSLSLEAVRSMKASINDFKNNKIKLQKEEARFLAGFESGIILKRIKKFNF